MEQCKEILVGVRTLIFIILNKHRTTEGSSMKKGYSSKKKKKSLEENRIRFLQEFTTQSKIKFNSWFKRIQVNKAHKTEIL